MLRNISVSLLRKCISPGQTNLQLSGIRYLYTPEALGIDGYNRSRERVADQYNNPQMKEKFLSRMQEFLKEDSTNLVFTDDMKTMVNLATDNPDDLTLLSQMIERFQSQSSGLRFGTFAFGPVVMRFYYLMNKPVEALAMLQNPKTVEMFDQLISYQIAMDLLLTNKMNSEVLTVFRLVQQRNIQGQRFPKNCFVLALAALFNENTPESLATMQKLLSEANEAGHIPVRRVLTYAAGLALKQNDLKSTVDILSVCKQQNYVTVRNLKILAYAQLGRLEDLIVLLRSSLDYDVPEGSPKRAICKDVMEKVTQLIGASDKKEVKLEFSRIQKLLVDRDLIQNQDLDDLLTTPIQRMDPTARNSWERNDQFNRNQVNASFNRGGYNRYNSYERNTNRPLYPPKRPGLGDME